MYNLLISIIIFSAGFSTIVGAQNANNSTTTKTLLNHNSKHFTDTSTKELVVEYKSLNKVAHNKNKGSFPSLKFYRIPEKTLGVNTTQPHETSHNKTIPNSMYTNLKYARIKKVRDSIKVENQQIEKDN